MTTPEAEAEAGIRGRGLSAADAARRLALDGPNTLPTPPGVPAWRRLAAEMVHFFALLFWVAGALAFVAGLPQLGVAVFVVILLNGVFAFVQEERAEHASERLRDLLPRRAMVIRDGVSVELSADELVVGDLVQLHEGDRISADLSLDAFPPDPAAIELTELESADLQSMTAFMGRGTAYTEIQGKNPQTLAYGLTDSPAGLAGWIVEKFKDWTDNDGDLEAAVSRDQILTDITVYWVTNTINSSIRLYYESRRRNTAGSAGGFVRVPTAVAIFPKEMIRTPEPYAATQFNVVRYTRFDRGGHFAALEEPDLLVADVEEFFRSLLAAAAT